MFRWANERDVTSDLFMSFCTRNGIYDRHNNINRYWEYPWAFYNSGLKSCMKILDIGTGYSTFPIYIRNEIPEVNIYSLDPSFISYSVKHLPCVKLRKGIIENIPFKNNSFDLIFCISVLEHLSSRNQEKGFKEIYRVLKPGGRFILTVDYFLDWKSWKKFFYESKNTPKCFPENNVNLSLLLLKNKFLPFNINMLDYIPYDARITNKWLKSKILLKSNHINSKLFVTSIGLVLFKPFSYYNINNKIFCIKRSWINYFNSNDKIAFEYISVFNSPVTRKFWLPKKLLQTKLIKVQDVSTAFYVNLQNATELINDLVCKGILSEVTINNYPSKDYLSSVGHNYKFISKY